VACARPGAALIAERDPLPTRRLADDGIIWAVSRDNVTRPHRVTLLVNRSDDNDLPARWRTGARCGVCKRRQRPLGIHCAAPVKALALDAHRDLARDGVDVPQEHDLPRSVSDDSDRVASLIVESALESDLMHAVYKPIHRPGLRAGWAVTLHQPQ
jgi:hypothetical protein